MKLIIVSTFRSLLLLGADRALYFHIDWMIKLSVYSNQENSCHLGNWKGHCLISRCSTKSSLSASDSQMHKKEDRETQRQQASGRDELCSFGPTINTTSCCSFSFRKHDIIHRYKRGEKLVTQVCTRKSNKPRRWGRSFTYCRLMLAVFAVVGRAPSISFAENCSDCQDRTASYSIS